MANGFTEGEVQIVVMGSSVALLWALSQRPHERLGVAQIPPERRREFWQLRVRSSARK